MCKDRVGLGDAENDTKDKPDCDTTVNESETEIMLIKSGKY